MRQSASTTEAPSRLPPRGRWLSPSLLLTGSLALGGGFNYLYHIALGRILGPKLYGAFAALLGIFYLLWIFSQSVQLHLARRAAVRPEVPARVLKRIFGIGLGIALGVAALSVPLAGWLRLATPLWVVLTAAVWLLVLPLPAAKGLLQGRQRFGPLALLNVLEPLMRLPLGLLLVLLGAGLAGAWGAWGLAALLALPVAVLALRRAPGPKTAQGESPLSSRGYGLGLPLLAAGVLAVPTNVDVLVAKHAFPPETAGLYAAAAVLGKGFLFVAISVGSVLLPRAAASSHPQEHLRHLGIALALGLGINGFGALLCALVPGFILSVLFGSAYAAAAPWLRLYGAAMLAFTGVVLLLHYGLARGRRDLVTALAALSALEIPLLVGPYARTPEGLLAALLGTQLILLGTALALVRRRGPSGSLPDPERAPHGPTVAVVAPYPPPGSVHVPASGVASYTRNLVEALRASGSGPEVRVLAQKLPRSAGESPEKPPHVLRCWTSSWLLPGQISWAVLARRPRPRIVHLQHELFLFGGGLKAALFPLLVLLLRSFSSVIVTLHGVPSLRKLDAGFIRENGLRGHPALLRLGLRALIRTVVHAAARTVVHEEVFRGRLVREYGCPAERIVVLPHGIESLSDTERASLPSPGRAKRALGLEGKRTILYLGYLTGYKGVEMLLEGFALAAKDHPDWVLLLGGGPHPRRRSDPEYRAYLRCLEHRRVRLGDRVLPLGFVPEERLPFVFQAADVVVFPYRAVMASSGPMALCVQFERPFLASREFAGILPEPLLFPPTPEGVRSALERFFSPEGEALARLSQGVARRWRAERSWERVAARTQTLYRALGSAQTEAKAKEGLAS